MNLYSSDSLFAKRVQFSVTSKGLKKKEDRKGIKEH